MMSSSAELESGMPDSASFECNGWLFSVELSSLCNSRCAEDVARQFGLCRVPDMLYAGAKLCIHHASSGTLVELATIDALRCCCWEPLPQSNLLPPSLRTPDHASAPLLGAVECQFAGRWRPHVAHPDVHHYAATSDWTCSTPYWGRIFVTSLGIERSEEQVCTQCVEQATDEMLPKALLGRHDQILWYQEILFWEDELEDNGVCRLTARIRVMPSFWFVLLVCELRVDNVLVRELATRFFHKFESDHVLREWTWKEATFEMLQQRGSIDTIANADISQTNSGVALLGEADVRQQLHSASLIVPFAGGSTT